MFLIRRLTAFVCILLIFRFACLQSYIQYWLAVCISAALGRGGGFSSLKSLKKTLSTTKPIVVHHALGKLVSRMYICCLPCVVFRDIRLTRECML